ncbi:phosphoribosyltransferase [Nocardioides sp. AX2bis]|uniref:phosphoribosyltransferase n=1 Tax=Nocardioides sp. AX2bis TaxID=2653157 RepID=UPI0012F20BC3|nr:Phosphoribosyltransferase [Nocardioides sp. AX2bis]
MDEREVLTWETFGRCVPELAGQVVDDGYRPDLVLSVARGGLALGMGLGYALGVKACAMLNVEFYTGVDAHLDEPVVLSPGPSPADLAGRRVLVADDVADTGRTLAAVRDLCLPHAAEVRVAVLYDKPGSLVRPDYSWRRTDRWIDFPWSSAEAAVSGSVPA